MFFFSISTYSYGKLQVFFQKSLYKPGLTQTLFEVNGNPVDHFCPQFCGTGPPIEVSNHHVNPVVVPYCFWDIKAGQTSFSRWVSSAPTQILQDLNSRYPFKRGEGFIHFLAFFVKVQLLSPVAAPDPQVIRALHRKCTAKPC